MEFDELKKIWDVQDNKPVYAFNETQLHKRILSKKHKGLQISNVSEWLTIIINLAGGLVIILLNTMKNFPGVGLYLLGFWMLLISLYAIICRTRRLRLSNRFDLSMYGDLLHALSVATYQVRFSYLMRLNSLPVALLIILSAWESGKFFWLAVATSAFILVANFAAGWEHHIYKSRRQELQVLKNKLDEETLV